MRITNAMMKQFVAELEYESENGFDAIVRDNEGDSETVRFADGKCKAFSQIAQRLKTRFKLEM